MQRNKDCKKHTDLSTSYLFVHRASLENFVQPQDLKSIIAEIA